MIAQLEDPHREGLRQAFEERRVAARIAVFAQGRELQHESRLYADGHAEVHGAPQQQRLEITLSSVPPGRPIWILDVHREAMDPQAELGVRYLNAREALEERSSVTLEEAEGLSSLLSCRSAAPGYWTLVHEGGRTLFLCVPQGPAHTFVVTSRSESGAFPLVAPLGLGVLAGVLATVRLRRYFS